MKKLLLLLLGCAAWSGRGESLPERYTSLGELIVTVTVHSLEAQRPGKLIEVN
jgi:hypothetical protein